MYAQIIDDTVGKTLVSASTVQKEVKAELEKTNDVAAAALLGTVIAKRAIEKGITTVVFDRGGFIYQGKIQALADAMMKVMVDQDYRKRLSKNALNVVSTYSEETVMNKWISMFTSLTER